MKDMNVIPKKTWTSNYLCSSTLVTELITIDCSSMEIRGRSKVVVNANAFLDAQKKRVVFDDAAMSDTLGISKVVRRGITNTYLRYADLVRLRFSLGCLIAEYLVEPNEARKFLGLTTKFED